MKKGNLDNFILYLEEQVQNHSMYVWGGQGQCGSQITEYWIRKMERDTGGKSVDGKYYTYADLAVDFWKKQCQLGYGDIMCAYDCSGLLVWWLLANDCIATDRTSSGLFRMCEVVDSPKKGYWVFRTDKNGNICHVGVLISDSEVIHAKGRIEGVCQERYSKSYWHKIGKPNCMDFEPEPGPEPKPTDKYVHPKGNVRVRTGNGTKYKQIKPTATKKDYLPYLGQAEDYPNWYRVLWQGQEGYISSNSRYTEVVEK